MEWPPPGADALVAPKDKVPWEILWPVGVVGLPAPGVSLPITLCVDPAQAGVPSPQVPPQESAAPQATPLQTGIQLFPLGAGTLSGSMESEQPVSPSSRAETWRMRRI
jgi:hypothetical protein